MSRYWCHECEGPITPMDVDGELSCSTCSSPFIEEVEEDGEDHPSSFVLHDDHATPAPPPHHGRSTQGNDTHRGGFHPSFPLHPGATRVPPVHFGPLAQMMSHFGTMFGAAPMQVYTMNGEGVTEGSDVSFPALLQRMMNGGFVGSTEGSPFLPFGRSMDDVMNQLFMNRPDRGPPPTSEGFINSLRVEKVSEELSSETPECAICQEMYEPGDESICLPCSHRYHADCIKPWLSSRNTCPVCRYELPTEGTPAHPPTAAPTRDTPMDDNSADSAASFYT